MAAVLSGHYSANQLAEKFKMADTNKDNKLSLEEFLDAI